MFYALINYTNLNSLELNSFRKNYDPWADLVGDHLTVIYPVPDSVNLVMLVDHIQTVSKLYKPFDIHIRGLEKSWDHFLLLTLQDGKNEVIQLHDMLYSGPLAKYRRTDLKFNPQIGLGLFVKETYDPLNPKPLTLDEEKYKRALQEAKQLDFDFWRKVQVLTLLRIDDTFTRFEDIKEFRLG